ncbi:MAG: ATP-binding cassette domain-containing protein [Lactobacillaceae bacterium]|jgi:ABC-type lipoprotein export system ATPase subunit/ABC-type antimicrobial peptide transport system permease subunit|nr:ATP-binding cassette domain-containing protein [Lactobacillaceae bacterium]
MAIISLKAIHKSYFLGKEEFPVLKGIDLEFELGEFVSILGESGGGKSTLMNIIGGLDRNFEGEVTVDGEVLDHKKEKKLDAYRRGTVGYIYQAYNLISHLTVLDNVLVALDMTELSSKERTQRALDLLASVGLSDQVKKHPNQLSGGQKQRVAIARALASDPQIIIADEPTGALDAQNTDEVLAILQKIAEDGKLVIAVTHSQDVANHGTRIVHLADGKIDGDERIKPAYAVPTNTTRLGSRPMSTFASYRNAFKHLTYNFWRNSLIMLGTAIGIFAVLLFSGLGNGIQGYIQKTVNDMVNPNSITVMKRTGKETGIAGAAAAGRSNVTFTAEQVARIKKVSHIKKVEPGFAEQNVMLTIDGQNYTLQQAQTYTSAFTDSSFKVGKKPGANEIVLDKKTVAQKWNKTAWKTLVGKKVNVVYMALGADGKPVQISQELTVSGITDSSTQMNLMNYQTTKAALKANGASTGATYVSALADSPKNVKATAKKINAIKVDGKKIYNSITVGDILKTINTIVDLATNVLAAIAAISLVVSALMIIVSMYMSVSERVKEIGILRALGESKRDIRQLFTSESLFIGLFSALLALVLAYGIGAVLNQALYKIAKYNMIQISLGNIIFAFVVALIISFLAALLPARRASKLNPIDALSAD